MEVPTIKEEWHETRPYLEMLAQTVVSDIVPLLSTVGGAPHAVAREVFSYVDHLGHLFTGKKHDNHKRVTSYLRDALGLVDANYGRMADVLYQMYRNGPVHEFDPKVLERANGDILAWWSYRGRRHEPALLQETQSHRVTHLVPLCVKPHVYYLPVSTTCLVLDLLSSIDRLMNGIEGTEEDRIRHWIRLLMTYKSDRDSNSLHVEAAMMKVCMTILACIMIASFLLGCGGGQDIAGQNDAAREEDSGSEQWFGTIDIFELRTGQCFAYASPVAGELADEVTEVELSSCSDPIGADFMVTHMFLVERNGNYPGERWLGEQAALECPESADFNFYPTSVSWEAGDRTITCLRADPWRRTMPDLD